MNYLIARVSDKEQKKALPAQKKRLLDYAEKQGWQERIHYKYIELDESAYHDCRTKYQELVIKPLLTEKELVIVVHDKIDRLSRQSTSEERAILTKLFRQGKIELHFPSDNLYINKASPAADLFRLDIGVALAGYYSSAIRDAVMRRFDQMLADGFWVGRAPIGYLNYQEPGRDGKIVHGIRIDELRAPFIVQGFELRSTGLPYKSISKIMKERGLVGNTKNRRPIGTAQWEEIINNPFYMGRMRYDGKIYDHNYPPLIEQWLWDKCLEVKNQRANGKTKYNAKPFLFKKLKCHVCGYSITFDGPKTLDGTIYGHCTEYGGKHGAKNVKEAVILEQVKGLLKAIQVPKAKLPFLVSEIEKHRVSEQKYYLANKTRLEAEYDELDAEVQELYKDRRQFKSRMDVFEKMVKEIESKQKTILQELEDHSNGDKAFVLGASYILEVCTKALDLFTDQRAKLPQKRYLLDFIVPNLELDGEKLVYQYKEPFEAIKEMVEKGNWRARPDSNRRSPP